MERLFVMDLHDYELEDSGFSRPSARGVIFDDCRRIALVYSKKIAGLCMIKVYK